MAKKKSEDSGESSGKTRRTTIRRQNENTGKLLDYDKNNPRDFARTSKNRNQRRFNLLRSRHVNRLRATYQDTSWKFPMDIIENNDFVYVHSSVRSFHRAIKSTNLVNVMIEEIKAYTGELCGKINTLKKKQYPQEDKIKKIKVKYNDKEYNLLEFYSGQNAPVLEALRRLKQFLNLYKDIMIGRMVGYNKSEQAYTYTLKADNTHIEEGKIIYYDKDNNVRGRQAVINNISRRLAESLDLDDGLANDFSASVVEQMEQIKVAGSSAEKTAIKQNIYNKMNSIIASNNADVRTVSEAIEMILTNMSFNDNARPTIERAVKGLNTLDKLNKYVNQAHIDFGTLFEFFKAQLGGQRVGGENSETSTTDIQHIEKWIDGEESIEIAIGESLKYYTSQNLGLEVEYSARDMKSILEWNEKFFKHFQYFILNYAFISDYQIKGKSDTSENYLVNNDVWRIYHELEKLMQKMMFASGIIAAMSKRGLYSNQKQILLPYILTVNNKSVYIWDIFNSLSYYIENDLVTEDIEFNVKADGRSYYSLVNRKRKAIKNLGSNAETAQYAGIVADSEVNERLQSMTKAAFGSGKKDGMSVAKTKIYIDMARIMEEQTGTKAV